MSRRPRHAPQLLIRLAPMLGAVGLCLLPMRALAVAPFVLETVDGGAGQAVGEYSSMKLDRKGHPHIAYYDAGNSQLKYAHHEIGRAHV